MLYDKSGYKENGYDIEIILNNKTFWNEIIVLLSLIFINVIEFLKTKQIEDA